MADLIERSAAIAVLDKLARDRFTLQDYFQVYLDALKDVDMKIRKLPAVDAVPVVHGRWILVNDKNGQHAVCEYCGEWKYHTNQKFCGECGARMDGGGA